MEEFLGWPLPKRIEYINQKLGEIPRPEKKHTIKFKDQMTQFDIHSAPIGMLKYRLANGRTIAAQEEYLSEHPELNNNFFDDNHSENTEVQKAQHEILTKMFKSPNGDLKAFFKKNKQEFPLIITREGFVVNGNRRLCTMRELLKEDINRYTHFNYIDVIILPHCLEEDIDRLEAQLQIIRDVKADYGWISEAKMLLKRHTKYGYSYDQLASLYEMSVKDVQYKLNLLTYVDAYLESIGKPREYNEIEKDEFAFKQIKKFREKLKVEEQRVIFQTLAFSVISSPKEESDGRLYNYIPKISNAIEPIISRLISEIDIEESPQTELDDLLDTDGDDILLGNLAVTLDNVTEIEKKKIISIVKDVIDTQEELDDEEEMSNYSFNRIKKANTLLKEAYLSFNEQSNTNGIEEQINSIEETIISLRKAIAQND
ncbi:hypothetical protein BACPU_23460 [Bacillus pumilus]|nr:hypothetical protein BACPU_23460 [Bacillus pumilus]